MMEHHYYQMDEVWHALYNRAEMRYLNDPENESFRDEEAQKKQIKLFSGLMKSTCEVHAHSCPAACPIVCPTACPTACGLVLCQFGGVGGRTSTGLWTSRFMSTHPSPSSMA
jgi:hypothetical protein